MVILGRSLHAQPLIPQYLHTVLGSQNINANSSLILIKLKKLNCVHLWPSNCSMVALVVLRS